MKFAIRNRYTGDVQFTADIDCGEEVASSLKIGMAVKWALQNGADLSDTDLRRANLRSACLSGADLSRANLSGANLSNADLSNADLDGACLSRADLIGADLSRVDLRGADLSLADLREADLRDADLRDADLCKANLGGADLRAATGLEPERTTPLLMLLDQPDKIRLYKLTDSEGCSPIHPSGKITYAVGGEYSADKANTDISEQCGAGINVATLDWCLRYHEVGYRIFIVEFTAEDIACIPTATDGKFRLHRCKVVGEKDISHLVTRDEAEKGN